MSLFSFTVRYLSAQSADRMEIDSSDIFTYTDARCLCTSTWGISQSRTGCDIIVYFEDKNICVGKKRTFSEYTAPGRLDKKLLKHFKSLSVYFHWSFILSTSVECVMIKTFNIEHKIGTKIDILALEKKRVKLLFMRSTRIILTSLK